MSGDVYAYGIEAIEFEKLRAIAERLQGGTDYERDEGHRLWLIVTAATPLTAAELPPSGKPEGAAP